MSQAFVWATIVEVPAFSVELEPFTTVVKTSTPNFMAFSLKFRDKRSIFHAVKNHTMGFYQTFVNLYIDLRTDLFHRASPVNNDFNNFTDTQSLFFLWQMLKLLDLPKQQKPAMRF